MENFDKLKEILADVLGVKIEVIMSFEDKFGIEISDEEAEKIISVKDALDYINSHAGK